MKTLEKILYVEDEMDIQSVAKIAIETVGGFTLKVCSSGDEALNEAESYAPDLFLLDVMMPGLDGPSTLVKLREIASLSQVPAIFMTAKVQSSEIDELLQLGALGVIPKPFDPMTLATQIKKIWESQ
ncbi:MAG: response regulator [Gammaproteobacteria bacterium]|nr:response regulator [Gammaproteobacteria bacterium]